MRYIWKHLRAFVQEDFDPVRYGLSAAWIALLTALNFAWDLEETYLDPYDGTWGGFFGYLGMYAVVYVPLLLPFRKEKLRFGALAALALVVLAGDVSISVYKDLTLPYADKEYYFFIWKITQQLQSLLTTFLPLAVLYVVYRPMPGFYGLSLNERVRVGPYLLLLALMVPLVAIAAPDAGFQNTYPTWQRAFTWPQEKVRILLYEVAYGYDFIATEIMFRGLFVIALMRYGGSKVVVAACGAYCALHYGKPLGECISSVFGGYILGAMAYRTGNIWGGVIVHIGIALMMDTFALLVRLM